MRFSQPLQVSAKDMPKRLRVIAVCFIDGKDLNAMMVGEGWALAYRDYSEKYVPQENTARKASKGIWAMRFVPPWEWRRGAR